MAVRLWNGKFSEILIKFQIGKECTYVDDSEQNEKTNSEQENVTCVGTDMKSKITNTRQ